MSNYNQGKKSYISYRLNSRDFQMSMLINGQIVYIDDHKGSPRSWLGFSPVGNAHKCTALVEEFSQSA